MIKRIKDKVSKFLEDADESAPAPRVTPHSREPDLRIVGLFAEIEDDKIAEIVQALLHMNEINKLEPNPKKRKDIEFYLSTYGGSADDMFALYDMMKLVERDTDISTIGVGKVMSAGVLILAGGTHGKRKIGKNCRVMLHSVIAGNQGSVHSLINELDAVQDMQRMYIDRLVEETKMTKKQLKNMLEQKVNVYLSAEQAIEYGIADKIM